MRWRVPNKWIFEPGWADLGYAHLGNFVFRKSSIQPSFRSDSLVRGFIFVKSARAIQNRDCPAAAKPHAPVRQLPVFIATK